MWRSGRDWRFAAFAFGCFVVMAVVLVAMAVALELRHDGSRAMPLPCEVEVGGCP